MLCILHARLPPSMSIASAFEPLGMQIVRGLKHKGCMDLPTSGGYSKLGRPQSDLMDEILLRQSRFRGMVRIHLSA